MTTFRKTTIAGSMIVSLAAGLGSSTLSVADERRAQRDAYVKESIEVSDHEYFGTTDKANGATILIRDHARRTINVTMTTSALMPNYAYSVWTAVFNRPNFCAEPYQCKVSDLESQGGDPRVKASVFWSGGFIADANGHASTSFTLKPGRTKRELFAKTKDYGLYNFHGSEIHNVIRSHGETGVHGPIAKQIGTANEACPPDNCKNVFASIHVPQKRWWR